MSPKTGILDTDFSRWLSLRYFNFFRLILAGLFVVIGTELGLGAERPATFTITSFAYFISVLTLGFPDVIRLFGFNRIISIQITIDITALSLIMWSSGGYRSGMPILMMVILAGVGLIAEGRMVIFFAALTSIAVLVENSWRLATGLSSSDFFQIGLVCIGFFTIAITAHLLALRAKANASLAASRGAELTKQQAINEHIIQDMQDGIIVVDRYGRILQANPQASSLLNLPYVDELTLSDTDNAFKDVLSHPTDYLSGRLIRIGPNNRLVRCRIVQGDTYTKTDYTNLIYLTDLEEILKQHQQLKLAALGRLTASMAHEIRNPLAAITQATELLQDDQHSPMHKRLLRIISDNAHRIERLIRDVLAIGRREHASPENIQLSSFVQEHIETHCLSSPEDRKIYSVNIAPELQLTMDRTHLQQILDNLLNNARRHCSGQPEAIQIYAEKNSLTQVTLHIKNDGPCINEEQASQLFEPFFTTHPRGTGLGLYIARELAEANDVELQIITTEQRGAHFTLTGSCYSA